MRVPNGRAYFAAICPVTTCTTWLTPRDASWLTRISSAGSSRTTAAASSRTGSSIPGKAPSEGRYSGLSLVNGRQFTVEDGRRGSPVPAGGATNVDDSDG